MVMEVMMAAARMMVVMTVAWRPRPMAAPHRGGSLLVSFKVATMVLLMWMVGGWTWSEMMNDGLVKIDEVEAAARVEGECIRALP